MIWEPAQLNEAARLWKDGATGTEIAQRFGVSRNAVMGLIHRKRKLFERRGTAAGVAPKTARPTKKSQAKTGQTKTAKAGVAAYRQQKPSARPAFVAPVLPPSALTIGADPAGDAGLKPLTTFAARRKDQCAWPLTSFFDRHGPDTPVCGRAVSHVCYCARHAAAAGGGYRWGRVR